jgi:putative flavoprotein involved in K+ transport
MRASDTASPQGSNVHSEEIIIVGAGQAGLSIGYWLKRQQRSFLLLEAGPRIGESWRQRYDSLVLFTPRRYSALPGLTFPGAPAGCPAKDEVADYLHTYADHFALPVQVDTQVVDMQKHAETFVLHTTQGIYQAATVIVATGPFHHPRIPAFASALSPQVEQLHSASYHNPSQIPPGPVLVVGAGDSGAHIAAELARAHAVSLAAAHPLYFVSLTLLGKSLFWFLGFPWQPSRGSALVGWVSKDARRLASLLQTRERVLSRAGGYS